MKAIGFCSGAVLRELIAAVLCTILTGIASGHHMHPYLQHYHFQDQQNILHNQHQSAAPYNSYLGQLSGAEVMYLPDGTQQNRDLNQQNFQNHFHHLDESYLRESAKDPKNLRNGVYQPGAMTYDLGMPQYEVLNPHDPPEIITSDQPHYHTHLLQLQQSQNFTLEDFGVTTTSSPSESTHTTTEDHQEPQPDLDLEQETTTTTENPTTTTTSSSKELKVMQQRIEKELSKTKEKLQKLSEQIKNKCEKNKAYTSRSKANAADYTVSRKKDNDKKKTKPSPFKPVTPHPPSYNGDYQLKSGRPQVNDKSSSYNFYAERQSEQPKPQTFQSPIIDAHPIYRNSPSLTPTHGQGNEGNMPQMDVSHIPQTLRAPTSSGVIKSAYGKSALNEQTMYGQSSPYAIQPKYAGYQTHQSRQNAYNEAYNSSEDPAQISLNSIQRLYRSASFLTNPENKAEENVSQSTVSPVTTTKAS